MKRRREQERDEAIAREQADARREALLAELKAHQVGPGPEPPPAEPEPRPAEPDAASDADEPAVRVAADEPPGDVQPAAEER